VEGLAFWAFRGGEPPLEPVCDAEEEYGDGYVGQLGDEEGI